MKKFTLCLRAVIISVISLSFLACNNDDNGEKIFSSAITGNQKKVKLQENDLRFLIKAYSTSLFKIALANEAEIRSTSAESIQLGRAITTYYTNLNSSIHEIVDDHGFELPMDLTDDQKIIWKQLVKEKGLNFDKKFKELLQNINTDEMILYQQAAKNSDDKAVKLLAQKVQPELQLHESLKQILEQKLIEEDLEIAFEEKQKSKLKNSETKKGLVSKLSKPIK